jgi:hypothetical protein
MCSDRIVVLQSHVRVWPIATNFSLAPDVSFWGEADLGRAAEFAASVENDPKAAWTGRATSCTQRT